MSVKWDNIGITHNILGVPHRCQYPEVSVAGDYRSRDWEVQGPVQGSTRDLVSVQALESVTETGRRPARLPRLRAGSSSRPHSTDVARASAPSRARAYGPSLDGVMGGQGQLPVALRASAILTDPPDSSMTKLGLTITGR